MDTHDITAYKPANWGRKGPGYMELDEPDSPRSSHAQPRTFGANVTTPMDENLANDADNDLTLWQAVRKYPKITWYCLAMTTVIIGWGYQLVVAGAIAIIDSFVEDFGEEFEGEMIIKDYWLSLWNGLPAAGAALGCVAVGWLQDRIGRKYSLMIGTLFAAASIGVIVFSFLPPSQAVRLAMITAGFTLQSFAVGIIKTTSVTYISENVPTRLRGPAMALFPTFTLLGQLAGMIVLFMSKDIKGRVGYLGPFGSMWILTVPTFLLSCIMPDSPSFLLRKGREAAAVKATKRLFAPKVNPQTELNKVRAAIESEKAEADSVPYLDLFKGTDRRRTLIVLLASLVPTLFGLDLLSNASIFLERVGLKDGKGQLFMMAGIIAGMLANGAGMWIMTRGGRRTMSVVSMAAAGLLWGAMGISGFWKSEVAPWVAGGIMVGVLIVCGMGCWPASYAIVGETSSLKLRAATQGVAGVVGQVSSVLLGGVLPFIYNPDAGNMGAKTGFLYCALCAIGLAMLWFFLPEMKDRSAAELDQMFEMRLPTRKFEKWKTAGHQDEAMVPLTTYTK
jgi:SP family general alpha glucoside:H+ symporter-like MFS transporter